MFVCPSLRRTRAQHQRFSGFGVSKGHNASHSTPCKRPTMLYKRAQSDLFAAIALYSLSLWVAFLPAWLPKLAGGIDAWAAEIDPNLSRY